MFSFFDSFTFQSNVFISGLEYRQLSPSNSRFQIFTQASYNSPPVLPALVFGDTLENRQQSRQLISESRCITDALRNKFTRGYT
jgi:hypothetical protein